MPHSKTQKRRVCHHRKSQKGGLSAQLVPLGLLATLLASNSKKHRSHKKRSTRRRRRR